jgi:MoaA/NifB/PqqE/SkfB family radical SAM enzyme
MLTIPYLEVPITHVCNLRCDGCGYYSNYKIKTMVSADEIRETVSAWSRRIKPRMVKILGGEPLVNRQLPEIFLSLRQLLPESHIQTITNGLQLDKCPILPHLLSAPNTSLSVSIHSNDDAYLAKLQESMNVINGWVVKFGNGYLERHLRELETASYGPRPIHEALRGRRLQGKLAEMSREGVCGPVRTLSLEVPADRQPASCRGEILAAVN